MAVVEAAGALAKYAAPRVGRRLLQTLHAATSAQRANSAASELSHDLLEVIASVTEAAFAHIGDGPLARALLGRDTVPAWATEIPPDDRELANARIDLLIGTPERLGALTVAIRDALYAVLEDPKGRKEDLGARVANALIEAARRDQAVQELDLQPVAREFARVFSNLLPDAVRASTSAWRESVDIHLENIERDVASLVRHAVGERLDVGVDTRSLLTSPPPLLDSRPLPPAARAGRSSAVALVRDLLNQHGWVALTGLSGSGKTQLALALADKAESVCWLRGRNQTAQQLASIVDQAAGALTEGRRSQHVDDLYRDAFGGRSGRGRLLVIDDMPRLQDADELTDRLCLIAALAETGDTRLLTTSANEPPLAVVHRIAPRVRVVRSPDVTSEDTAELLRLMGAPDDLLVKDRIDLLVALSRRHFGLASLIARYLQAQRWQFTEKQIEELFEGRHTAEVTEETIGRLMTTVPDEKSRELLYRLNLVTNTFDIDDVVAVCDVAEPIDRPRERLTELTGLWVQRESSAAYSVAPPIKAVARGSLTTTAETATHAALAARMLKRRSLTPLQAVDLLMHLLGARTYNKAGALFIQLLHDVRTVHPKKVDPVILNFWAHAPIPVEMDLELRLYIRGLQVDLLNEYGRDTSYALDELDRLLEQTTSQQSWGVVGALVSAGSVALSGAFDKALARLRYLFRQAPYIREVERASVSADQLLGFEDLLWAAAHRVDSREHVLQWLDFVIDLDGETRARLFSRKISRFGCVLLAERLQYLEYKKPAGCRDWEAVVRALDMAAARAARIDSELLQAALTAAKIVAMGDAGRTASQITQTANDALARLPQRSAAAFIIAEATGHQLVSRDAPSAAQWLHRALDCDAVGLEFYLIEALLWASKVASDTGDSAQAKLLAARAIETARQKSGENALQLSSALGDAAILHGRSREMDACSRLLDEAAEVLFSATDRPGLWTDLVVVLAHAVGYYASLALTGIGPAHVENGGPYVELPPGTFVSKPDLSSKFTAAGGEVHIGAQLATLAAWRRDGGRALAWMRRSHQKALAGNLGILTAAHFREWLPTALGLGQFEFAASLVTDGNAAIFASDAARAGGSFVPTAPLDTRRYLASAADSDLGAMRAAVVTFVAFPFTLDIGLRLLEGRPDVPSSVDAAVKAATAAASVAPGHADLLKAADILRVLARPERGAQELTLLCWMPASQSAENLDLSDRLHDPLAGANQA